MKKYFVFAAMALVAAMNFSCSENDNGKFTITDESGNQYPVGVVATFEGEVGTEASLKIGVYDRFDIYGVDFGDGNIITDTVCFENGGLKGEDGLTQPGTTHKSMTEFKGTVSGKGIVRVFGKSDMWALYITGLMPTTFYEPSMAGLHQLSITSVNIESLSLPTFESLTQLTINNTPVKSVNVSNLTALTSLTINNTTASKYEPQLESIDVSKNTELTYLSLQGNTNHSGKLKSLDLTNNTKLQGMGLYVQYNQISDLKLPTEWAPDEVTETQTITYGLTVINVQNNKLTSLNTENLKKLKNLYAADNQLTSIDVSAMENLAWFDVKNNKLTGDLDLTANKKFTNVYVNGNELTSVKVDNVTKQFYFDNNKMTIATMPDLPAGMNTTSKKKQFHYAPQADMEVTPAGAVVDLSAQAKAKGMEAEEVATTYTVKAGDATLVADTDYKIEDGKITFLKSQKGVVVEMTTAAFPTLTLKTKAFDVTVAE